MDMDRVFGHIRSRIDSDCLVTNARDQIRDGCKMSMQGIAEKKVHFGRCRCGIQEPAIRETV